MEEDRSEDSMAGVEPVGSETVARSGVLEVAKGSEADWDSVTMGVAPVVGTLGVERTEAFGEAAGMAAWEKEAQTGVGGMVLAVGAGEMVPEEDGALVQVEGRGAGGGGAGGGGGCGGGI